MPRFHLRNPLRRISLVHAQKALVHGPVLSLSHLQENLLASVTRAYTKRTARHAFSFCISESLLRMWYFTNFHLNHIAIDEVSISNWPRPAVQDLLFETCCSRPAEASMVLEQLELNRKLAVFDCPADTAQAIV